MSSTTTLKAVLVGQDKSMGRTFTDVGGKAERTGKKVGGFGKSFLKLAGPIGLGIGAIAAGGAAVGAFSDFLSGSIAEAREAEKVGKTTAQIIKATGGSAKVSAGQVADLAEKISEKAGVDDEAIQSGANLLLTFKKVRNETGKGANVFDRATQAAVDLAAAGFGSITSNSKILGQALNDPLKGMGKLKKAGVDLTDQQKKQIKAFVESGDVLSAQKIILGEVESQVGGVAAASADMGDKVKVSWDNLKEQVGTALLPILDKLGKWFLEDGLPAIKRFGGWISEKLWPALKKGYDTIMPGLKKALDILSGGVGDGEFSWKKLGDIITQKVIPFIAKLTNVYLPMWATQIRTVIEAVKVAWGVFTTWRDIMLRVTSAIMGGFIAITRGFATMLRALGHVPGFGWAKTAADKMDKAADQAARIKTNIDNIPSKKNVRISVHESYTSSGTSRFGNNGSGYSAGRASGGPTGRRFGTMLFGEHGPELWSDMPTGHVTPARQTAQILSGRGSSGGSSRSSGGYDGPDTVQVVIDGRVVGQALLRQQRLTGPLGLR